MRGIHKRGAPSVPEEDRNNPQVLRDIFADLIDEEFAGSGKAAAAELQKVRSRKKSLKGRTMSANVLYDIIKDRTQIKYWHLETVANYYSIPVGILLLFSRMKADLRDVSDGNETAKLSQQEIRLFVSMLPDLLQKTTVYDHSALKEWVSVFDHGQHNFRGDL